MEKLDGVANTLYVPLYGRIYASKKFPEYFYDEMALKIEEKFTSGISKGSFEYTNMAYAARYYNMDKMIIKFIEEHKISNIVLLGIGLETAYDRITQKCGLGEVNYYGIDLPEVIEIRKKYFGKRKQETLIAGDMFEMDAIAACYIGGTAVAGGVGTVTGAVVGAFIMGVLNNGMSLLGWSVDVQRVVKGLVLLAAVAVDVYLKQKKKG